MASFLSRWFPKKQLEDEAEAQLAADGAHAVLLLHVGDFVAEDVGQGVGVVTDMGQDSAGEKDVAARCGKGVDDGAVQDGQLIGNVLTACLRDHVVEDALDPLLARRG